MCTEVWIDGEMITSLGEMRKALGRDPVHDDPASYPESAFEDDCCLCSVKHHETAALIGRVVDWNEWGDMVYAPAPTTGDTHE